jgi:hypothetical protein
MTEAGTSRSPLDRTVSYSSTGDLPVIQLVRALVVLNTVVMEREVMIGVVRTARLHLQHPRVKRVDAPKLPRYFKE